MIFDWYGFKKNLKKTDLDFEYFSELQRLASRINKFLHEVLPLEPSFIPVMTYEEAVKYFINEKPKTEKFKKGAMLIEPHAKGYIFIQVFLDQKNNLIQKVDGIFLGRRLVIGAMDEELKQYFGNNDLVIVE